MKPDRFDILVISAVLVLGASAAFIGATGASEGPVSRTVAARIKAAPPDPAVYAALASARKVMEAGQPAESITGLEKISAANPLMSEPHALMGEAYARMLDYPAALKQYRLALMLDADYVDKKSPRFIGKRIKSAVKEGMAESRAALDKDPANASAKAILKDAYYLERMLAGGCE